MAFLNDLYRAVSEAIFAHVDECLTVNGSLSNNDQFQIAYYTLIWSVIHLFVRYLMPLKDFNIKKMRKIVEDDTRMRIVSIFHAIFQIWLATTIVFFKREYFRPDNCGKSNSQREIWFIHSSIAYLLYDFSHKTYFGLINTKTFLG